MQTQTTPKSRAPLVEPPPVKTGIELQANRTHRFVCLANCSETTANGMRAWMQAMSDDTICFKEAQQNLPIDVVMCDPSSVAQANADAARYCAVLATWGEPVGASAMLPHVALPVSPERFNEFVKNVESQIISKQWSVWWRRSLEIANRKIYSVETASGR